VQLRTLLAVLVLISSGAASGCFGVASKSKDEAQVKHAAAAARDKAAEPKTSVEKFLKQSLQRGTITTSLGNYWVMWSASSPEGTLTAFTWSVPQNGVEHGRGNNRVTLVAAPLLINGTASHATAWSLMAFREVRGKAVPVGSVGDADARVRLFSLNGASLTDVDHVVPATDQPLVLSISGIGLEAGDRIHFVLAVRANPANEWGIAFYVVPEYPRDGAPKSFDDWRAAADGLRGVLLTPRKSGMGLKFSTYFSHNLVFPPFLMQYRARTPDLEFSDASSAPDQPLVSARDLVVRSKFEAGEGYGQAFAYYFGDVGLGKWSISGDLHGQRFDNHSVMTNGRTPVGPNPGATLFGYPFVGVGAEGAGGAQITYQLTNLNVNEFESLGFKHISLGASLTTMLGIPAAGYLYSGRGLAGQNFPPGTAWMPDPVDAAPTSWPTAPQSP
jgi:hypothetical protein